MLGRDITAAFQILRELKQIIVVCYDEPWKMDKEILSKFDAVIYKEHYDHLTGAEKYRHFTLFVGEGMREIIRYWEKEKRDVPDNLKDDNIIHRGSNNIEIPVINDINESEYRSQKRKYNRLRMKSFYDKYRPEYEEEDREKFTEEERWYKPSEVAKKIGLHTGTIKQYITDGKLKSVLRNNRHFISNVELKQFIQCKS